MGTTKDPEGFRRHTAGRRQVLGARGGTAKRRGCGLGLAVLLAALALGAAAWTLRGERDAAVARVPAAALDAEEGRAAQTLADVEASVAVPEADAIAPTAAALEPRREPVRPSPLAPPAHAAPASESGHLEIRLLRGWSDAPLAGAEVHWIGIAELARLRREGLTVTTVELEPVLQRIGRREASGPDGRLSVAADGCHLLVVGDGWTRELEVLPGRDVVPDAPDVPDVRVFAPRTLVLNVVDGRGRPALAFHVELWRVDARGEPQRRLDALRTSPATGSIRFEDIDSVLSSAPESTPSGQRPRIVRTLRDPRPQTPYIEPPPLERTRLRVALDPDLAPDAWAEVDLARDPLPHVRLQLPPLGELRVVVAQSGGQPVSWRGRVELRLAGESGSSLSQELAGGRAEFPIVRFGRALHVRALRADGAKGEETELAALTPDEPTREVVLADVPAQPRLLLRPIHPDGFALPRTWIDLRIAFRRPSSDEELAQWRSRVQAEKLLGEAGDGRTDGEPPPFVQDAWRCAVCSDARGYLDLPLPESVIASDRATLTVSLLRDGRTLTSAGHVLERGEAWADVDLGSVLLQAPSPVAGDSK